MKQYGVLVGCNNFGVPGAELRGCINDLRSMYEMLATYYNYAGWEFNFLVDGRNTAENQRALIARVIGDAVAGDIVAIHNSSHGTKVPVNGKIEHANCAYGFDWNRIPETFVLGSQYQALISAAKPGVKVYFTTDSCNSGEMMTRGLLGPKGNRSITKRFMQQPIDIAWQIEHLAKQGVKSNPRGLVGNLIDVAFASGCGPADTDYSADCGETDPTTGQERFFGAFTEYFCKTVLANKDKSFEDVINLEASALATDQFEQRPMPYGAGIKKRYCAA